MTSVLDQNISVEPNTNNTTTDPLGNLVGEGKKFKTVEDLARGKLEADAFIQRLQDEAAQIRKELDARLTVEEQLKRHTQAGTPAPAAGDTPQAPASLDEKAIESLLDAKFKERQTADTVKANKAQVDTALLKMFDNDLNKARAAVAQIEQELGIKVSDIASASPQAALRLFGGSGKGYASEHSTHTSLSFNNQNGEVKNKAYYDNLKRTMGTGKFLMNHKIQNEMHKDAMRLGADFYK